MDFVSPSNILYVSRFRYLFGWWGCFVRLLPFGWWLAFCLGVRIGSAWNVTLKRNLEFASSNKVWKTSLGIKSSRKSVLAVFLRVCFKRCGRGRPRVQALQKRTGKESENNDWWKRKILRCTRRRWIDSETSWWLEAYKSLERRKVSASTQMSVLFAKFQTIRTLPLQRSARVEMNEKTSERVWG